MKYNPAFLDKKTLIRSFVARHVELDLILEIIRENTVSVNQHILVVGPRGIGKTTLVLRVAAAISTDDDLQQRW
ncbi:MAG: ATP-binding protein, partial [Candidatus Tectomicrobia bacterium]